MGRQRLRRHQLARWRVCRSRQYQRPDPIATVAVTRPSARSRSPAALAEGPVGCAMAVTAAKASGGAGAALWRAGARDRNGAMEAPPERSRDQRAQRRAKGPVSFVMAVRAAKPPDGPGAAVHIDTLRM
ncbi:MAG: hypothetical protein E6J43_13600 [Chloroflexi bacterium]|nr:MAG: hypothetical protein E6J43_13600 [Chloroflexota bacterium]